MKYLYILLIFIPVTLVGKIMGFSDPLLFVCSSLAIIPLAGVMGKSTDDIACFCGQKIGGLLNATFGNATELIIAFVAMKAGMFDVVKASLAGSVIGNILLVLGLSMLVGGLKYKTQTFNKNSINITSSMLLLAVLGLSIPAIFTCGTRTVDPGDIHPRVPGEQPDNRVRRAQCDNRSANAARICNAVRVHLRDTPQSV